ncbi:beta-lactamase-like protein [Acrodontium crateriforme]|uniref:Beta-lactamase-like protein n=1 Tax=Acrodontium crateriforme TaxID=150365 RepID=A0AAQ3M0E7_9PEZI|nr:beta-lactamase-like protein [Acrodontium crateriforme]
MAQTRSPLPPPAPNQRYVTVSPMAAGYITLSDHFFVHPAEIGAKRTVPSLAFLITHPGTAAFGDNNDSEKPFRLMWDLGLRRAKERYPEVTQKHLEGRAPYDLYPGVAEQLSKGGLDPADVNLVIISHVHYDHHGDPEDFPQAQFVVGNGAMNVLKNGVGDIASHQHFDPNLLPMDRSDELSAPTNLQWKPMGPFPAVLDLFSDGSVFVIDTPGHLPGHLNLLCRTEERWICLCGDAFHDRRLLTGEKEIGTWEGPEGNTLCIHLDKESAAESIRRLQEFEKAANGIVELIAAHEDQWWETNKHKAFPGTI